jgi:hypothetical protein
MIFPATLFCFADFCPPYKIFTNSLIAIAKEVKTEGLENKLVNEVDKITVLRLKFCFTESMYLLRFFLLLVLPVE